MMDSLMDSGKRRETRYTPQEARPGEPRLVVPIGLSDGRHWARFFWWDGAPEALRAGVAAIRGDMQGARAPWDDLVWVVLTPKGCLSTTNRLPAPLVASVALDDDAAIARLYSAARAAAQHDHDIRMIVRESLDDALGRAADRPMPTAGRITGMPWVQPETDAAFVRITSEET